MRMYFDVQKELNDAKALVKRLQEELDAMVMDLINPLEHVCRMG